MTKTLAPKVWHYADTSLELRTDADLPNGVAGRVSGVAFTYDTIDSYGTTFARGCAKRSIDTRVAAKKLPLLMDHERATRSHVGVVTSMADVGDAVVMTADIFDTEEGRSALEYVKAVLAAGASTGFSIGFIPRRSEQVMVDGTMAERFQEIELREVSVTPMPAVPGADVTAARHDPVEERSDTDLLTLAARAALDALPSDLRAVIIASYADASGTVPASDSSPVETPDGPTPAASRVATMDERLSALRQSYHTPQR